MESNPYLQGLLETHISAMYVAANNTAEEVALLTNVRAATKDISTIGIKAHTHIDRKIRVSQKWEL